MLGPSSSSKRKLVTDLSENNCWTSVKSMITQPFFKKGCADPSISNATVAEVMEVLKSVKSAFDNPNSEEVCPFLIFVFYIRTIKKHISVLEQKN